MNSIANYMSDFFGVFSNFDFKNALDILIITLIFYKIFSLIQNTKAEQLFKGFVLFLIVMKLSEIFGLVALTWMIKSTLTFGVIAFIVIFQPEFRKVLEHLGKSAVISKKRDNSPELYNIITNIETAVFELSKTKTGALIVMTRVVKLNDYIDKGTPIDAIVTSALLLNSFIDGTPLHDGAIIIQDDRIKAANCVMPLTEKTLSNKYGTRHRAALGISEHCDAISIVVSEETGKISICENGKLKRYEDKIKFKSDLTTFLDPTQEDSSVLGKGAKIWSIFKKLK